ncbi:FtsX-like permease family protein [Pantoea dispersa]|uniref:FtsX-like permease family protein n=1 Tax=Pantoea dispersa TaxID=59814 RepID=UPI003212D1FF
MNRTIIYLAMVIVMSVSNFIIASTLVMAVKDKSSDISVLKTLGAGDKLIRASFIWYGVFASFTGSVCGMVAGVLISLKTASLAQGIEFRTGNKFFSGMSIL